MTYGGHRRLTQKDQQRKGMFWFIFFTFFIAIVIRFGTTNILIAIAGLGLAFLIVVVCLYDMTGHNVGAMAERILGDISRSRRNSTESSVLSARLRDHGRYEVICPNCSHTIAHPELPKWPYVRCENCSRVIQLRK